MTTVNAYASPSATEDLVPTTIERRDVGPHDVLIEIKYAGICHSDIHTVRGDWGPQSVPAGSRPRDRRHRRRGRLRRDQARRRRPGRRRLHGQLLRRVRQLPEGRRTVLPEGNDRHLRRRRPRRNRHPGRLLHPRRRDRGLRGHHPRGHRARRRRAAAVRRHHHLLAAAPLGRRPRQEGRRRRARRAWPHGRQARLRDGRGRDRPVAVAEEAGGRPAPGRRTATTPPAIRARSNSSRAAST